MFWILLFLVAALALSYAGASITTTSAVFGLAILLYGVFGHAPLTCALLLLVWAAILLPLNVDALRQEWFTRPLLSRFRERLRHGPWSDERDDTHGADTRGGGWEAQLLQPRLDWERLQALPTAALSEEEQAFLEGPVETFCRLCHAWRTSGEPIETSKEIWTFLRRYGLLAMRIPREYGGLGYSSSAVAAVLAKIGSSPGGMGASAIVAHANAPGLTDWLLHQGSDAQRLHWLSRLARGEAIACIAPMDFGGSRPGGERDYSVGTVTEALWEGVPTLGVQLDLQQTAVPLAPVADLIAVRFDLEDPQRRLGRSGPIGPSCALLPRDTAGLQIDRQHRPLDAALPIGPVHARSLFIPLDWLLGGAQRAGQAAHWAGESLDAGRDLPLTAAAAGNAAFVALATAARLRLQRRNARPLSDFESTREYLARMTAQAYGADALRRAAAAALDRGERSAAADLLVASQGMDQTRRIVAAAMDLNGIDASLGGPSNWLGYRWQEAPQATAMVGASDPGTAARRAFLEALRQGHPCLSAELAAAHDDNPAQALEEFDALIWPHLGRLCAAAARSWLLGITGSLGASVPTGIARRHRQRASRYAAALTLHSEAVLLSLGDELNGHEELLTRLGEILGLLYRVAALLRKWDGDNRPADDWAIVDWACLDAFREVEAAFGDALRRTPSRPLRWLLRILIFPFGRWARPPSPALSSIAATRLCSLGSSRQRLTALCFAPRTAGGPLNMLDAALGMWLAAEPLARRCEQAQRQGLLPHGPLARITAAAVAAGLIDEEEARQLGNALDAVAAACAVDDFPAPQAVTAAST